MQRHASLISLVLVALVAAGASTVAADGNRKLQNLIITKPALGFTKTITVGTGGLSVTKGAGATGGQTAAAAATPAAPTPAPEQKPAAPAPAAESKPATGAVPAAPAPAAAPAALPRGAPVAGTNDINQALQCQNAFNARGGRAGVESALGDVCKEGSSSFNALGCCQATAKLLNSGNLNKCACNNLVYQQLCQEVKVQDLTCDTLRPTLVGCGLQC